MLLLGDNAYWDGTDEEYQSAIDKRSGEFTRNLEKLREQGPRLIRSADIEVTQGYVVDEIVEKVEASKADLLVVSSRKLSTLGRLLGSVTEALLTRCPCSLLILHDQGDQNVAGDDSAQPARSTSSNTGVSS